MYIIQFEFKPAVYGCFVIEASKGYLSSMGMTGYDYTSYREDAYEMDLELANRSVRLLKKDNALTNIQVKRTLVL